MKLLVPNIIVVVVLINSSDCTFLLHFLVIYIEAFQLNCCLPLALSATSDLHAQVRSAGFSMRMSGTFEKCSEEDRVLGCHGITWIADFHHSMHRTHADPTTV